MASPWSATLAFGGSNFKNSEKSNYNESNKANSPERDLKAIPEDLMNNEASKLSSFAEKVTPGSRQPESQRLYEMIEKRKT